MEEQAKQVAELLKILANSTRLLIICALMERPMNVGEIAQTMPKVSSSVLSQNLMLLKAHRILDNEKSGQHTIYSITDHRVEEIMHTLKKYYCQ